MCVCNTFCAWSQLEISVDLKNAQTNESLNSFMIILDFALVNESISVLFPALDFVGVIFVLDFSLKPSNSFSKLKLC